MPSENLDSTTTLNKQNEVFLNGLLDVIVIYLPKYEKELISDCNIKIKQNGDIDMFELL